MGYKPINYRYITNKNHSEIGVICTNLANELGSHPVLGHTIFSHTVISKCWGKKTGPKWGHTSAIDESDGFGRSDVGSSQLKFVGLSVYQQAVVNVPKYGDVEHHRTKTAVSVGDEISPTEELGDVNSIRT